MFHVEKSKQSLTAMPFGWYFQLCYASKSKGLPHLEAFPS